MAGEVAVADLPTLWREKMRNALGLAVPSDTLGVLQDVHWSSGMIGSFPTYTLGNVMSSQFFAAASNDPTVNAGLDSGDYRPLRSWLNHHVHRHGRSRSPSELLTAATGRELDLAPYLNDLQQKVTGLRQALAT
jgi:carboxypeptidase Taq